MCVCVCVCVCVYSVLWVDPEILKREGGALYVGHHGCTEKKMLGFRWSKKAKKTLKTISFLQNIYISIYKLSPFLMIKSYRFFKHVDKEREKTRMQWSIRKEKLEKVGLCFITGCFIKPFKIIINHFLFLVLIRSAIMAF